MKKQVIIKKLLITGLAIALVMGNVNAVSTVFAEEEEIVTLSDGDTDPDDGDTDPDDGDDTEADNTGSSTETTTTSSSSSSSGDDTSSTPSVPQTIYNNYSVFQKKIADDFTKEIDKQLSVIAVNPEAAKAITFDTNVWMSFDKKAMTAIKNSPVDVVVKFRDPITKTKYQVVIPAGTDTTALLNEEGYCGFMYLSKNFGATVIE